VKPYSLERKPKPCSIGGDPFITPTKRMVGLATASQIALRICRLVLFTYCAGIQPHAFKLPWLPQRVAPRWFLCPSRARSSARPFLCCEASGCELRHPVMFSGDRAGLPSLWLSPAQRRPLPDHAALEFGEDAAHLEHGAYVWCAPIKRLSMLNSMDSALRDKLGEEYEAIRAVVLPLVVASQTTSRPDGHRSG
jgi:hypothetical protein